MVSYDPIGSKMVQNCSELFQTCPNLSKTVQKGPIWSNMILICLKYHPIGSGITRSPCLVLNPQLKRDFCILYFILKKIICGLTQNSTPLLYLNFIDIYHYKGLLCQVSTKTLNVLIVFVCALNKFYSRIYIIIIHHALLELYFEIQGDCLLECQFD